MARRIPDFAKSTQKGGRVFRDLCEPDSSFQQNSAPYETKKCGQKNGYLFEPFAKLPKIDMINIPEQKFHKISHLKYHFLPKFCRNIFFSNLSNLHLSNIMGI